jgi:beta-N-acetylhexosaminidase
VSTARQGRRGALVALVAALVFGGCGTNQQPVRHEPPGRLALGLPVDQAVAQLFAVGLAGTDPSAPMVKQLRHRDWGVLVLDGDNTKAPFQTRTLVGALRAAGKRGGRPEPLIADGAPDAFPGSRLAPAPQQGSTSVALQQARSTAKAMSAAGVHAVLGPVADIGDPGGPAEATAFGPDADTVSRLARGAASGWLSGGVQPIPGHFPGEGGASQDPEQGAATVGLTAGDLRARDVKPFQALASRAGAIQVSDALYTAFDGVTPAALLPDAYRMLRRAGYQGTAMSGDLVAATAATGGTVGAAAVDALRAGADLLYVPGDAANQEEAYRAVLAAVRKGKVSNERLAEALGHVAALKRTASGDQ